MPVRFLADPPPARRPNPATMTTNDRSRPSAPRFSARRASEADVELLRTLAAEAFPATYAALLAPAQIDYMMAWMYSAETIRREMAAGMAWFVAEADGVPCGYFAVEHAGEALYVLQKIYLLPRFQGHGGGAGLFRRAVEYVRGLHRGPCRLELHVNRGNRAVGFYERMGMRRLREGDFDIGGGYYMNDYIMGMELDGAAAAAEAPSCSAAVR